MRPSTTGPAPPSPVLGVGLWKNDRHGGCDEPSGSDPGWILIGVFELGETTHDDPFPEVAPPDCRYYALTVRVVGPGGSPNELQTFRVGVNSQPVSTVPTAVRIATFHVAYAGHGVVSVVWQSGIEGGVAGFYVARGPTAEEPFSRVSDLVPSIGDGSRYSFIDTIGAGRERVLHYRLEAVGLTGSGIASAHASVTIPGRRRRNTPSVR